MFSGRWFSTSKCSGLGNNPGGDNPDPCILSPTRWGGGSVRGRGASCELANAPLESRTEVAGCANHDSDERRRRANERQRWRVTATRSQCNATQRNVTVTSRLVSSPSVRPSVCSKLLGRLLSRSFSLQTADAMLRFVPNAPRERCVSFSSYSFLLSLSSPLYRRRQPLPSLTPSFFQPNANLPEFTELARRGAVQRTHARTLLLVTLRTHDVPRYISLRTFPFALPWYRGRFTRSTYRKVTYQESNPKLVVGDGDASVLRCHRRAALALARVRTASRTEPKLIARALLALYLPPPSLPPTFGLRRPSPMMPDSAGELTSFRAKHTRFDASLLFMPVSINVDCRSILISV